MLWDHWTPSQAARGGGKKMLWGLVFLLVLLLGEVSETSARAANLRVCSLLAFGASA